MSTGDLIIWLHQFRSLLYAQCNQVCIQEWYWSDSTQFELSPSSILAPKEHVLLALVPFHVAAAILWEHLLSLFLGVRGEFFPQFLVDGWAPHLWFDEMLRMQECRFPPATGSHQEKVMLRSSAIRRCWLDKFGKTCNFATGELPQLTSHQTFHFMTHSLDSSDCTEHTSPASYMTWTPRSLIDTHLQTRTIQCLICKLHPALSAHLHVWLSDPHQNSSSLSKSGINFTNFRCFQHRCIHLS